MHQQQTHYVDPEKSPNEQDNGAKNHPIPKQCPKPPKPKKKALKYSFSCSSFICKPDVYAIRACQRPDYVNRQTLRRGLGNIDPNNYDGNEEGSVANSSNYFSEASTKLSSHRTRQTVKTSKSKKVEKEKSDPNDLLVFLGLPLLKKKGLHLFLPKLS